MRGREASGDDRNHYGSTSPRSDQGLPGLRLSWGQRADIAEKATDPEMIADR